MTDKVYKVVFVESPHNNDLRCPIPPSEEDLEEAINQGAFGNDTNEYRLMAVSWPTPYQACLVFKAN